MADSGKGKSGCLWAFLALQFVVIVMLVVGLVAVCAVTMPGGEWTRDREMGVDDFPDLTETWSTGGGKLKVVRINLNGAIFLGEDTGLFGSLGAADMALASIRRATHDPEVRGIILDIDSPGGGITASDVLYDALLQFREQGEGRHVVAMLGDTAASGGYYVAAATDHIVARPTTVTGSIGVLMQSLNIEELAQKIGIRDVTIKSGQNKDMLNPFNALDPEQVAMLQAVIDSMHSRFVDIVAKGRGLDEEHVRSLADGRIFTAQQALELGLVDDIGYWRVAMSRMEEMLGVDDLYVVRYEEAFSLSSLLGVRADWSPARALAKVLPRSRFLYLWKPF